MTTSDTDKLHELLWSFAKHRVLTVAGRTGILGRIAGESATISEVARDLGLDPLAAGKVLRALTALGVADADGESYRLSKAMERLFASGPDDLTPFLDHSHHLYDSWGENLERWLKGEPWETTRRGPEGVKRFGEAMQAMASTVALRTVAALDLSKTRRMLDIGGGLGAYAKAFCNAQPGLRAMVFDTPETAEMGRSADRDADTSGRIDFIGGDYLQNDLGDGFDLVLIANVLHQETRDRAAKLVQKGSQALSSGGRLVVVDFSIDDEQRRSVTGALFAINMRSFGDTHSEPLIRQWFESAGIGQIRRIDLDRTRWIITGVKSG